MWGTTAEELIKVLGYPRKKTKATSSDATSEGGKTGFAEGGGGGRGASTRARLTACIPAG